MWVLGHVCASSRRCRGGPRGLRACAPLCPPLTCTVDDVDRPSLASASEDDQRSEGRSPPTYGLAVTPVYFAAADDGRWSEEAAGPRKARRVEPQAAIAQ